jgi:hypothetical protein
MRTTVINLTNDATISFFLSLLSSVFIVIEVDKKEKK